MFMINGKSVFGELLLSGKLDAMMCEDDGVQDELTDDMDDNNDEHSFEKDFIVDYLVDNFLND